MQEVKLTAKLRHPNIVLLWGYCKKPLAMIMEYCNLGSLSDNLYNYNKTDKANPILEQDNNWQLRKNIIKDMISGLYFLHSNKPKKIIHRDIKSANVLLQEDSKAYMPN